MTHDQYLSVYERTRKTSNSVSEAAYVVFKALNREVTYRLEKRVRLLDALKYANTVWQILSQHHSELKPDGFKNLTRAYAEKNEDRQVRSEILKLLEII